MAASVEIDLEVKQGLLELRSEEERLRLLARLFKAGIKPSSGRARSPTARRATARSRSASFASVHDHGDAAAAWVAGAGQSSWRDRAHGLRAAEEQVQSFPAHDS